MKRQTSSVSPDTRGRYLPVAVRRAAYVREAGQCAFVSPDGRRCPARGVYRVRSREAVCQTRLGRSVKTVACCADRTICSTRADVLVPCTSRQNCRPKARRVDDLSARMTKGSETDVRPTDSQPVAVSPFRRFAVSRLHFCLSQSVVNARFIRHWVRLSARSPKRFSPPNGRLRSANRSARTALTSISLHVAATGVIA